MQTKPIVLKNGSFRVEIDPHTGGILRIAHPDDPYRMNWVYSAGTPDFMRSRMWGLGCVGLEHYQASRTHWDKADSVRLTRTGCVSTYRLDGMTVTVTRTLSRNGGLSERYSFKSRLPFGHSVGGDCVGSFGIYAPFNDSYPDGPTCIRERCNAHLWCGGDSSYVCAMRMGGEAPHLGMVLTEGALSGYSVEGRGRSTGSNTRGTFLLHPVRQLMKKGQTLRIGWTLFWHDGWEDFFAQAMKRNPHFVRLDASQYTVEVGKAIEISAVSATALGRAKATIDGKAVALRKSAGAYRCSMPARTAGPVRFECALGGRRTWLDALVVPKPLDLIRKRCEFIVNHQQVNDRKDPACGAYVLYDNEIRAAYYDHGWEDHNEGRERLGMGVLLALYLQRRRSKKMLASLERYYKFVCGKLQDKRHHVFHHVGGSRWRKYNYPWVAQLHLEMFRLTRREDCLRRFVGTMERYYKEGGAKFYAIGIPLLDSMNTLEAAGWTRERSRLLRHYREHADRIAATGGNYPKHEVNYEQTIVGPAAIITLEAYLVTGDTRYLDAGRDHLRRLEMFNGFQPDYHLHDISIRHWDGFWFGKRKMWGDTFPHYWSAITGTAFDRYWRATGDREYRRRALEAVRNNFCQFTPGGEGACAYLYPVTVDGEPGRFYDPYANDQDWALVQWLLLDGKRKTP